MKRRQEPAVQICATFTPEQASFVKGLGRLGLSRLVADVMSGKLAPPVVLKPGIPGFRWILRRAK